MEFIDLIATIIAKSAIEEALSDFESEVKKETEKSKKSAVNQHIEEEILRMKKDLLNNSHFIYAGNKTILVNKGKTYVSTVEAGDKYDKEKGVMSCLLKALGVSTSDIIKIMNK